MITKIRFWKGVLGVLTLYCYRYETVEVLLDEIDPSTDLYEGLSMVYQEMKDPVCPFHEGRAGFCKYYLFCATVRARFG
jgi:hypothetical protein